MPAPVSTASGDFPPAPVAGEACLQPIESWAAMYAETHVTGVEFEQFWFERVEDGVAYFFRWLREPRSTVLVVWTDAGPTHIECRTLGDREVTGRHRDEIVGTLILQFRDAGYWPSMSSH